MKMKNKEEMTATISTCIGLFDFLKEKVGERKTRTEAYCDLLDKTQAGFVSPFLRNQDIELNPGQCHVTVSDLASEWHWHRATVRSFLETLESFGQLERMKLPKSMVITMHLHDGSHAVPDIVQGTAGIVRQLNGILSEWINGSITSDDAGIACGQIVHQAITDAGLKYELPEDDCRVTLQKLPERMNARVLEIHTAAVECIVLAALRKVLRRSKPEESMELMQYFCFDLGASWPSFIDLSKTLAEQILNSGKEKDIDHDDDRQLLLDDLHDPFLSAAAKALEKSAGAGCRTPLYNHG